MEETEGERIKTYLQSTGRQQMIITEVTGIRKENVSEWMLGKKPIPTKHLKSICKAFPELNMKWVLTGEGKMIEDTRERNSDCAFTEHYRKEIMQRVNDKQSEIDALKIALGAQKELLDKYRNEAGTKIVENSH